MKIVRAMIEGLQMMEKYEIRITSTANAVHIRVPNHIEVHHHDCLALTHIGWKSCQSDDRDWFLEVGLSKV